MANVVGKYNYFFLIVSSIGAGAYFLICWYFFKNGQAWSLNIRQPTQKQIKSTWLLILYWASPVFIISLWGLLSYSIPQLSQWVPPPDAVFQTGWNLLISGTLLQEAWISFRRVFVGFTGASVVGCAVGLCAGSFLLIRQMILPTNSFLRYIPPTAFVALFIVYFGVGETFKYAVVFFGVIFFITQMVIDVVDDIDLRQVEVALTSDFKTPDIFWRIIVPISGPRILDVLRINLGAAWTFLVAAELIGAESGLGHFIAVSQRFLRLPDLYVGIFAFGVIGMLSDQLLELIGRKLFRWHYVSLRKSNR
ncbi:MAG: ABC transporter permease [Planctomycetes bacterium]|nr:ABC transporter permease [Planctomycetota bacterium]